MGHLPRDIWRLTPWQTNDLIQGWNDAQAGDQVAAPTLEQYNELVAKYG